MAFFSEKKEEKIAGKKASRSTAKKVVENKPALTVSAPKQAEFSSVLIRPMVTEKVHMISEKGQYAFFVSVTATKTHIKKAVENVYGVHVQNISTSRIRSKKRVRGNRVGYTRRMKKAIVSLRKGETITLFEGV